MIEKFDKTIKLKDNAMLKVRPDLFYEWDFGKNDELGLDIYKVTKGSNKIAWWICPKCNSSYDMVINAKNKYGCPYCRGVRVNHTNSLASLKPEIAKEWHPTKNGGLTPHDFACGSSKKVWWQGKCGHEWETSIHNRVVGKDCPYCSNNKILVGFNDMWTTNPELASKLLNPEDGYKYMRYSNKKLDWKCDSCGKIIKNKLISNIRDRNSVLCAICSDGVSYPEKFILNLLKKNNINFKREQVFCWSNSKRYDFFLIDYEVIVEIHGIQHYEESGRKGARPLEEEQANDKLKYKLAIHNGIKPDNYIVIDASNPSKKYLIESIENSKLKNFLDLENVDWENIHLESIKSLVRKACEIWSSGIYNVSFIAEELKMSEYTIKRYLREGSKIGLCKYPKLNRIESLRKAVGRKIVQLSLEGELIKKWEAIVDIERGLGFSQSAISACCKGKTKTSYGYRWMYLEDFEKYNL